MEHFIKDYKSLGDAVKCLKEYDVLYLDKFEYMEKIRITTPNITLIGNDTIISYNDYAQKIIPLTDGGDGIKTYGTTGSAAFTVDETAYGFKAYNITFKNSFKRYILAEAQAVAFKSAASNIYLENCKFIGEQDTLYIDKGINNKIVNSYVEGDIDFIFGSADCEFHNCEIKAKKIKRQAYFLAPSTLEENKYGFVFENCKFIAESGVWASIGRAWYPSKNNEIRTPKVTINNSQFEGNIVCTLLQMHEGDPRRFELHINNTLIEGKCSEISIVRKD